MRLILKSGVLVLTLIAMAASAVAGKLENAAIGARLQGIGEAPATASRIDIRSAGEPSFRPGEVLVNLPSNLSLAVIEALARRHQLTRLESQSVGLLGRTVHRWRIPDGRSVPDVILALKLDGGIDAQPNSIYTLQ